MTHALRAWLTIAALLLALPTVAGAAELNETFASDRPLGGLAAPGTDGTWTASLEGGAYTLRNETEPQALKYLHVAALPNGAANLAKAAVAVDVTVHGQSDPSGAGIMYRFDPASRTYLLFAILNNGDYAIFVRTREGIKRAAQGEMQGLLPGANRLSVRTEGEIVRFSVNGQSGPAVKAGDGGGGSIGIAALGKGSFSFDNLSINDAG